MHACLIVEVIVHLLMFITLMSWNYMHLMFLVYDKTLLLRCGITSAGSLSKVKTQSCVSLLSKCVSVDISTFFLLHANHFDTWLFLMLYGKIRAQIPFWKLLYSSDLSCRFKFKARNNIEKYLTFWRFDSHKIMKNETTAGSETFWQYQFQDLYSVYMQTTLTLGSVWPKHFWHFPV